MEEYLGLLRGVTLTDVGELKYKVVFSLIPGSEIAMSEEYEEGRRKNEPVLHEEFYTFYIQDNSMHPFGELEDCMDLYSKYEYCDNLNPKLRKQWKVGNIADNLAYNLIQSGILTPLTSVPQEFAESFH